MISMAIRALLLAAVVSCIAAFPQQNNGNTAADGFVFDGPADRSPVRPTARTTSTPVRPTSPTQASSTQTSIEDRPEFTSCVNSCPVTVEYNPVCGTDKRDYDNPGGLGCAKRCGKDVSVAFYGRCTSTLNG